MIETEIHEDIKVRLTADIKEAIILANKVIKKWSKVNDVIHQDDIKSIFLTMMRRKVKINSRHFKSFAKLILSVYIDDMTKSIKAIHILDYNVGYGCQSLYIQVYKILETLDYTDKELIPTDEENHLDEINFKEIQNINF